MRRGIAPVRFALIVLGVVAVAVFFAFTKSLPFQHHFAIKAVFADSNLLAQKTIGAPGSPVRIAGVNVGQVISVTPLQPGSPDAVVRMRIDPQGLPLHSDATAKIRPRLLLEGNFFVDLSPGSPSAPVMGDGATIPIENTAQPVQLDQILTALQSDDRLQLQTVLKQLASAFSHGGARGYNASIPYWVPAFQSGSVVNQATLGLAEHDLSGYIASSGAVAQALDRHPANLQGLITDFDTTALAFARQDVALQRTIAALPITLQHALPALSALDAAFPPVRGFARDALPAAHSSLPTIEQSMPFLTEARALVSRPELRGLVGDLRPTVPALAQLGHETVPLYQQVRSASSCQNTVILPWSHDTLPDQQFPATGPVYQEDVKWLPGIAAESRSQDANGSWFRVLLGGGTTTLPLGGGRFATSLFPILGVNPPKPASPIRQFRPNVPCETQHAPDLRTDPGGPPPQMQLGLDSPQAQARAQQAKQAAVAWLRGQLQSQGLQSQYSVTGQDTTLSQIRATARGAGGGR